LISDFPQTEGYIPGPPFWLNHESALSECPEYFYGVHPASDGAQVIAEQTSQAITSYRGAPTTQTTWAQSTHRYLKSILDSCFNAQQTNISRIANVALKQERGRA
jgi:hypothetical protein